MTIKILIVDDEENNRITIELLLEEFSNLEICHAKDGEEAVEKCKKEHFDLIFMDIMMPNLDGISATRMIKSFDPKAMVIALSALDADESKNNMLANGAEDYITKPIRDRLFHQRVKNYLQIVRSRFEKQSYDEAYNPFSKEIYSRSLVFHINSIRALGEFWDYYLNTLSYTIEGLEECIRIIYAYGQFLINHGHRFSIIAEENDDNLFLTLSEIDSISDIVVQQTMLKYNPKAIFILKNNRLAFRLPKAKQVSQVELQPIKKELDGYTQSILGKTHFNQVTASEYVQNTPVSLIEKIENLEEIKFELESAALDFERHPTDESRDRIIHFLNEFVEVIENLLEFEHFAHALMTLKNVLTNLNPAILDAKDVKKFSLLFISLLDDIETWRKNIFILQEANDIHYLDSSLLSSCLQLQSMITKEEISRTDGDELELF